MPRGPKWLRQTDNVPTDSNADASTQESQLLFMIEEEKMARDLYDAFYELTGLNIFDNISDSEQRHFDALLRQAARLDVDTSAITSLPTGEFQDEQLQTLYDTLLQQGSESSTSALEVGLLIEQTDIADLQTTIDQTIDARLIGVYDNLQNASENHYDAFSSWL